MTNEISNAVNGFNGFESINVRNSVPRQKLKVRELLHENMKQPGIIRDRMVCNSADGVAHGIFNALQYSKCLPYILKGIGDQRFIVHGDIEGFYEATQKESKPSWDVLTQGIAETLSPFGGGSSQREKDGGYWQNYQRTARIFEHEIQDIALLRITGLSRESIPVELHALFAELQKVKADFGIMLTETLPLVWVGAGKIYVKSYLVRLGEIKKLFRDAKNEAALKSHFVSLNGTLAVINEIAAKEDIR